MTRLDEIKGKLASGDYHEENWLINGAHADIAWLVGEVERLREAMQHIREYWNGSETNGAMSDALEEILATADKAPKGCKNKCGA